MATLTLDLSGRQGLVERYQGDINDTSASPELRYLGMEGQMADGVYNPFKKYGYMSPAVGAFTTLTGTVAAAINSIQFDPENDVAYFSEEGENILKLSGGLDDTSLENHLSITSGDTIKDMVLYEMNGAKALLYVIDSGDSVTGENTSTQNFQDVYEGGMYLGFATIDTSKGISEKEVSPTANLSSFRKEIDDGSSQARKLAQSFTTETGVSGLHGNSVSGVELKMRRSGGTGSGVTMKVSIQGSADRDTSPFTFQGDWATSTSYSVNDVIEQPDTNDINYQCHTAHTSAAADEPGVGNNWEDYWDKFGQPDGTDIASTTFSLSDIPEDSGLTGVSAGATIDWNAMKRQTFTFSSAASLSSGNVYWIVIEEVGTNMSASDELTWIGTSNGNYSTYNPDVVTAESVFLTDDTFPAIGKYFDSADPWRAVSTNQDDTDGMDFKLILNRDDNWSQSTANGAMGVETGQETFLYLADNGLVYWFVGNSVHTADGSQTGGPVGRVVENVLTFPDYMEATSVAETRSRMYIGVQTSAKTTTTDTKAFTGRRVGVFVWDRRSQVLGETDFFLCPGAKEIKALFTSANGDVKAITVGNHGFTEIRTINGNEFTVLRTLAEDAYPLDFRGISTLNHLSCWLGADGKFYGYGRPAPLEDEKLYVLGDMSGEAGAGLSVGPILVGNQYSSNPATAIIFGWSDTTPTQKVQKWYPYGEGTLDSVAQTTSTGNVYTKVEYLPSLSTVRNVTVYCAPTTTSDDTTIATMKFYKNQGTTPFSTKTVTNTEAARGYVTAELNEHNVNALQMEIEWASATFDGDEEFYPSIGIVNYDPTGTHTPDKG